MGQVIELREFSAEANHLKAKKEEKPEPQQDRDKIRVEGWGDSLEASQHRAEEDVGSGDGAAREEDRSRGDPQRQQARKKTGRRMR
jgi:hypothetical protein